MYVATINVPGYLPMDDDPPVFDEVKEAWWYLLEERRGDEDDCACSHGECMVGEDCPYSICYTHTVDGIMDAWDAGVPGSVYGDTPGAHSRYDLGLIYSVTRIEEED